MNVYSVRFMVIAFTLRINMNSGDYIHLPCFAFQFFPLWMDYIYIPLLLLLFKRSIAKIQIISCVCDTYNQIISDTFKESICCTYNHYHIFFLFAVHNTIKAIQMCVVVFFLHDFFFLRSLVCYLYETRANIWIKYSTRYVYQIIIV